MLYIRFAYTEPVVLIDVSDQSVSYSLITGHIVDRNLDFVQTRSSYFPNMVNM